MIVLSLASFNAIGFLSTVGAIFCIASINYIKLVAQCTGLVCNSLNDYLYGVSIYKSVLVDFCVLAHGFTYFHLFLELKQKKSSPNILWITTLSDLYLYQDLIYNKKIYIREHPPLMRPTFSH